MKRRPNLLTLTLLSTLASIVYVSIEFQPAMLAFGSSEVGTERGGPVHPGGADTVDTAAEASEMRPALERYMADRGSLFRSYPVAASRVRRERVKQFYREWLTSLGKLDFNRMSQNARIDYLLFKNHLEYELRQLEISAAQLAEIEPIVPFAGKVIEFEEARRRMEPVNSQKSAALLTELRKQVDEIRKAFEARLKSDSRTDTKSFEDARSKIEIPKVKKTAANRAIGSLNALRNTLRNWYGFYSGYDPVFTWWVEEPYRTLDQSLAAYATFLTERVVGIKVDGPPPMTPSVRPGPERARTGGGERGGGQRQGSERGVPVGARPGDSSDIIGDPLGREALLVDLAYEMIPYTPEDLIALGEKELAWCEAEMVKASRELGYGDDWRKALEHVKSLYVEPGKQPELIRNLALEAIKFLDDNDLITIPQLARDTWRMEMMSPERQLVNPFFTGGETITVSYPTNTMSHEQKMMSMRGNNIHFSRATVHHELIPGHHLQGFMSARHRPYRSLFSTPFWGEGWALYWELLLWDMNFARSPENRIGMLFWRMHRCARIIFSLSFHVEKMTPQQCIDLLVNRVGHEVENATAEVRRSFAGNYSPLYQCAYLLGGIQIRALRRELVDTGKMTIREFHDAVLKENRIPIEMVRASLTKQDLTPSFKSSWKFYGPNPGSR